MNYSHENSSLRLKRICAELQRTLLLEALRDLPTSVDDPGLPPLNASQRNLEVTDLLQGGSLEMRGSGLVSHSPSMNIADHCCAATASQSRPLPPTNLLSGGNPQWPCVGSIESFLSTTAQCPGSNNQAHDLSSSLSNHAFTFLSTKHRDELRQAKSLREMILMSSYGLGHLAKAREPRDFILSHPPVDFARLSPPQIESLAQQQASKADFASLLRENSGVFVSSNQQTNNCASIYEQQLELLRKVRNEQSILTNTFPHTIGGKFHTTAGTKPLNVETMLAAMILSAGNGLQSRDQSAILALPPIDDDHSQSLLSKKFCKQKDDDGGVELGRKTGSSASLYSTNGTLSRGSIKEIFQQLGSSLRQPDDPYVDVSDLAIETQSESCSTNMDTSNDSSEGDPCRRRGDHESFVEKLHSMLTELKKEGSSDIASFLPHGRAFAIHDIDRFVSKLLPKYFKQSKWSSFQRQLNLYGFLRIHNGPDKGGYYHELFLEGKPHLCSHMRRVGVPVLGGVDRRKFKTKRQEQSYPDFYSMKPLYNVNLSSEIHRRVNGETP